MLLAERYFYRSAISIFHKVEQFPACSKNISDQISDVLSNNIYAQLSNFAHPWKRDEIYNIFQLRNIF